MMPDEKTTRCRDLEERLADLVSASLPEGVRLELESHLEECRRCSGLLALARGEEPAAFPAALAGEILERTSGSTCAEVDGLLDAYILGTLEGPMRQLAGEHLEHCPGCGAVASTLAEISELLPTLAEADPGPGFTERVLRATAKRPDRPEWADRLAEWFWERLRSPRFSWEAAYLGSLILFGLFTLAGRVADPAMIRSIGLPVAASVEERLDPLVQAGGAEVREFRALCEAAVDAAWAGGGSAVEAARQWGEELGRETAVRVSRLRQWWKDAAS